MHPITTAIGSMCSVLFRRMFFLGVERDYQNIWKLALFASEIFTWGVKVQFLLQSASYVGLLTEGKVKRTNF